MISYRKVLEVANRLEELVPIIKEMVVDLRDEIEPDPYASIYWLRREISRLAADLGVGRPSLSRFANGDWESKRTVEPVGERVQRNRGD